MKRTVQCRLAPDLRVEGCDLDVEAGPAWVGGDVDVQPGPETDLGDDNGRRAGLAVVPAPDVVPGQQLDHHLPEIPA